MLIEYHRTMLADRVRNEAFYRALERVIVPNRTTVADIGSGTGLLGFMARRLGAREVYLYEQADIFGLSQQLARHNRVRNCHFHHDHSTNIFDPQRVDLVVSETLGNYAYEENILEILNDAQRFLKPGGIVMPRRIEQFLVPVVNERYYRELCVWDEVGFGLDFTPAKTIGLNNMYVRTFDPADLAAGLPARRWDQADLTRRNRSVRHGEVAWTFEQPTAVFGFALWWECELVEGVTLSTSPLAPKTHWEQLYLPVLEPITAAAGDKVVVRITSDTRPEVGVAVRWQVTHSGAHGAGRTQKLDIREGFIG